MRGPSHASTFCPGRVLFLPSFSLRSASTSYGNEKLLFLSWYEASTPRQPPQSGLNRTAAHRLTLQTGALTTVRPKMLDNEDHLLENHPRELTQNPLKKIWMPHKNSHIGHRRGKRCGWPHGKCANTRCDRDRHLRIFYFFLFLVFAQFASVFGLCYFSSC